MTGVKTDLGGAKQDIASTRTDLDATKAKLEKAMGDLGIQSGLVARNHDELELLKHKGDRNYFEFTLREEPAPAGFNHQHATEEDGPEAVEVHAQRHRR